LIVAVSIFFSWCVGFFAGPAAQPVALMVLARITRLALVLTAAA